MPNGQWVAFEGFDTIHDCNKRPDFQLGENNSNVNSPSSTSISKSSGCFVATAVFQNADCQPVVKLRQYRDIVLTSSSIGRWFIQKYVVYGPMLAKIVFTFPWMRILLKPLLTFLANVLFMASESKVRKNQLSR